MKGGSISGFLKPDTVCGGRHGILDLAGGHKPKYAAPNSGWATLAAWVAFCFTYLLQVPPVHPIGSRHFMKVLVPVKRVVDYNVKVRVKPDKSGVDLNNVKMSVNPFCEIAIEEAVRMKEAGVAQEVIAVSVGSKASQEQLRTCLALGADRAVLIETDIEVQPLGIAKALAALQQREQADVVIFGKQSIDGDNSQTGQMFAALTGMSQGTFASKATVQDGRLEVIREVDGGLQTVSIKLPAVVSTDLRLNEPRYASLPNIMKAKKKPLDVLSPADLGVDLTPSVEVLAVESPAERKGGIKVESVEQLVDKLKNEAKVI
jgi:electron transfer flavoprotein beta subunit